MGLFHDAEAWFKHFGHEIREEIEDILDNLEKLPLDKEELPNLPAVPVSLWEIPDTLIKLEHRSFATMQAKTGLSNVYNIKGYEANGYSYLYDEGRKNEKKQRRNNLRREVQLLQVPKVSNLLFDINIENRLGKHGYTDEMPMGQDINQLSLDSPEQFSISWTTYYNIYNGSLPYLPKWAATLSDPAVANAEFWPTIARYGMAYNLLILQKVGASRIASSHPELIKAKFGSRWDSAWDQLMADGSLYMIDLSIFENLSPQMVRSAERFTPATITLLRQDKVTKALTPIAVRVAGLADTHAQVFTEATSTPFGWIYALQAAKTSVTVYGIWLGHVYHWHIVTAALQMTMYNSLSRDHNLYKMVAPQSDYLIPFNDVLLLLWASAAPPTSINTAYMFLELCNIFAAGRNYHDDDPINTLADFGITEADFTVSAKWDCFPIAGYFLGIWDHTARYAGKCVSDLYKTDQQVADDEELQDWISTSANPNEGNVKGIGEIKTRKSLSSFLTSMIYRISVHGCSRLNPSANPALTFVANFPPCLQSAVIPPHDAVLTQKDIMDFLPKTGTIGEMMTFYNTFGFSAPYKSFLPLGGNDDELFFDDGNVTSNDALIDFRNDLQQFIEEYTMSLRQPESIAQAPQIYQWPLNIET